MKRRVAITGIGCVTPIGSDIHAFWNALDQGSSGIAPITRFDAGGFETKLAGEVKEKISCPEEFTPLIDEDIKIAFALEAARQAMLDARLSTLISASWINLGTSLEAFDLNKVIKTGVDDFSTLVAAVQKIGSRPLQIPLDTAAQLLSRLYGPGSITTTNVSACAAATQAIGQSFHCLRSGRSNMALCGGFDSMLNPLGIGGFQMLGALNTRTEQGPRSCRPFDSARHGTVLGEGAAMFVLEPLELARAEGKRIYAEIIGYASSLDAFKLSAPDPLGKGALLAMTSALSDAGIKPEQVDAVSAHGTGTYLNDEVEAAAIRSLLGEKWVATPVIATKALIGHLVGAAGAVELAAGIQGFIHNRLHPNSSLKKVAKSCELDHVMNEPRSFSGRIILKNSFGFGGQNACLLIAGGDHD